MYHFLIIVFFSLFVSSAVVTPGTKQITTQPHTSTAKTSVVGKSGPSKSGATTPKNCTSTVTPTKAMRNGKRYGSGALFYNFEASIFSLSYNCCNSAVLSLRLFWHQVIFRSTSNITTWNKGYKKSLTKQINSH